MKISQEKKHVAVFVFPFGSHPVPLLNLVLKLAHATTNNLQFSFIGTEHSNKPLLSKPHLPDNIKFYSVSDGVPEGHVLGNHPIERVNLFLEAGPENLQKGIDMAVAETKERVTCIIADAFKCANNSDTNTPLDFIPGLSKMRVEDLPEDVINSGSEEETLFSKTLASLGSVLPQAEEVVVNFFVELDPTSLVHDMRSKLKCFLYVGFLTLSLPLPPLPPSDTDATGCLSWLDHKKKKNGGSVAYVSFGTVVTPPPHEIVAVAEALEASGFPFLWSLKEHLKDLLPRGFLERTSENGKVVAWAPQTEVLGHGSVGVFVTHCGCNSVFENMCNGVPMVCRPFFGDHGLTGRMVEDVWEIGVRVEGGVFTKDGLVKCLRLVLVEEKGKRMKENALKVKKTVLDAAGPQGKAAQDFKTLVEVVT
uniref:Glycosyltransferase n=1 Tax=Glycine max TaxID=3847 RepID=I1ME13_SOYBN